MKRWSILFLALFAVVAARAQSYEYGKLICADGDTLLYRYLTPQKTEGPMSATMNSPAAATSAGGKPSRCPTSWNGCSPKTKTAASLSIKR